MSKVKDQFHSARTKYGSGDFYGMGVKAKLGRVRRSYLGSANPSTAKELKVPPKSLA